MEHFGAQSIGNKSINTDWQQNLSKSPKKKNTPTLPMLQQVQSIVSHIPNLQMFWIQPDKVSLEFHVQTKGVLEAHWSFVKSINPLSINEEAVCGLGHLWCSCWPGTGLSVGCIIMSIAEDKSQLPDGLLSFGGT